MIYELPFQREETALIWGPIEITRTNQKNRKDCTVHLDNWPGNGCSLWQTCSSIQLKMREEAILAVVEHNGTTGSLIDVNCNRNTDNIVFLAIHGSPTFNAQTWIN